ncbi:MAG: chemotaxis protein CheD [Pseudomonadota bacterium]
MKLIVGVADMKVSNNPADSIVTYSLGSCIGLVVFDFAQRVGGVLHYMLPESDLDRDKALVKPFMFADTGIPRFLEQAVALGASRSRMKVMAFGGSQILDQKGFFNIGRQNYMALKSILSDNNMLITHQEVGGTVNRTIRLDIGSGDVFVKTSGTLEKKL